MLLVILVLLLFDNSLEQTPHAKEVRSSEEFGTRLITGLREDANLDLSADEEYEDLRAELLAYHTALASLASSRRSMMTTPCWNLGGICIDSKLCTGNRFLTEVPGCKDKIRVCCFAWNRFKVRDMREHGIGALAMPWSLHREFGGKGISVKEKETKTKLKKKRKSKPENALRSKVVAVILKS